LIKKEFAFKLFAALQIYQVLLAELQKSGVEINK